MRRPASRGFTLIEVLVALGIVALALLTGLQASGALAHNAERQTLAMLGQVCAENELIRLRLQRQLPGAGVQELDCPQAGWRLRVRLQIENTPNPNFQRVDALVRHEGDTVLSLSTVVGRN